MFFVKLSEGKWTDLLTITEVVAYPGSLTGKPSVLVSTNRDSFQISCETLLEASLLADDIGMQVLNEKEEAGSFAI